MRNLLRCATVALEPPRQGWPAEGLSEVTLARPGATEHRARYPFESALGMRMAISIHSRGPHIGTDSTPMLSIPSGDEEVRVVPLSAARPRRPRQASGRCLERRTTLRRMRSNGIRAREHPDRGRAPPSELCPEPATLSSSLVALAGPIWVKAPMVDVSLGDEHVSMTTTQPTVIAGVDGSKHSADALVLARTLAPPLGATALACHVQAVGDQSAPIDERITTLVVDRSSARGLERAAERRHSLLIALGAS